jgi:hypothetical protein
VPEVREVSAPCPVDRDCQKLEHQLTARLDTRPTSVQLRDALDKLARLREFVEMVALLDDPDQPGVDLVTRDDLARAAREVLA